MVRFPYPDGESLMARGVVLILFNPLAGGGKARAAAQRIDVPLRGAGYETLLAPTRVGGGDEQDAVGGDDWPAHLEAARALVVVGGDGAVRGAAGAAIDSGTPLYHVPCGTANLFAGEFAMTGRPDQLLRALENRRVRWVDAALANGRRFLLMASVGFDAQVVHDLSQHRGASISHFSYIRPLLRQLRRWRPPELAVTVDGRPLDVEGTGTVVVANCRRYMWGLNPAPGAVMTDGKLDVVFLPMRGRADLVGWMGRCALGRHSKHRRFVSRLGSTVRIDCDEPRRVQLDGDPAPGAVGGGQGALHLEVEAGVLPVLLPPASPAGRGRPRRT
jgi:diacylglycerol kinase family enzyme